MNSAEKIQRYAPELWQLFGRFTNKHFTMAADQYRENASDSSVKRHDDACRAAEKEFLDALADIAERIPQPEDRE